MHHPLEIALAASPTAAHNRKLNEISRQFDGMPPDLVVAMTMSICVEAIAQRHLNLGTASVALDEIAWKAKQFLSAHYNPIGGRKIMGIGDIVLRN